MPDFSPPQDAVENSPKAGGFTPPSDSVEVPNNKPQQQVAPPQEKTTLFGEAVAKVAVQIPGFGNLVSGSEGVISAASQFLGFGGYLAGGSVGLIAEATGVMPKGYAADLAERSAKNLEYEPRTDQGKQTADILNYPMKKLGEVSKAAGEGTSEALMHEKDQQIRHAKEFGAPKWFTGTKEEYIARLEADQKKSDEAAPLAGALVENTVGMGIPILGGKALGGALKALPEAKEGVTKDAPSRPPEVATPEEKQAYKDKIQEIINQRKQDSGPLVETAIRNKETGEVEKMGPKHDEARKEATKDTHEQGFMTEKGYFLTRQEAYDHAKRNGQLPENHDPKTLDFPQEGLHSGDLRTAGDDRFKLSEDKAPPVPKTSSEIREDLKGEIRRAEERALEHEKTGNSEKADKMQQRADELRKNMPPVEFKDRARPTDSELRDHFWDAKTVGDVLKGFTDSGISLTPYRTLFKVLNTLKGIHDVKMEITGEQLKYTAKDGTEHNALGLYFPNGTIQMGKGSITPHYIHEIIHAATHKLLEEGNSFAAQRFKALFEKYEKSSYNIAHPVSGRKAYGFTNAHEFIAEAFSNWRFQLLLNDIKLGKSIGGGERTLWTDFKDSIKDALGLKKEERTALDEILHAGQKVMEEQEKQHSLKDSGTVLPSIGSEEVDKAAEKVDVRTIPDKKTFYEHATDIYEKYGEDAALQFFEDYAKEVKERQIPTPTDNKSLDKNFHTMDAFTVADKSEQIIKYKESTKDGVTDADRKDAFDALERGEKPTGKLGEILKGLQEEKVALVRKAKAMGIKVGEEFESGQNRIRLFGTKDRAGKIWQDFFANKTPMGEKVAEQANAAHERKVFGIDGTSRVVEIHRIQKDQTLTYRDPKSGKTKTREVKKGTEVWEWKDGKKEKIAHSDNLEAGKKDSFKDKDGKEFKLSDGKVHDIEKESPYRYLHDAEASARVSLMGLRKYVREAEFFKNLTESKMFETVGHGPDKPLETLPKGWVVPSNIDRIPQLRGWHFDPKTAAIIEDFAKVWDNNAWMKMTNQIIKAIMLNPFPHMMNEFMHLWNARGLSGWVSPGGLASLSRSGLQAWKDVALQSDYYREIMKNGGSILGATPRNNFFEKIHENASKEIFDRPEGKAALTRLAAKIGTTVADLYNGVSRKSQQAMWFTRDLMYVQYVREIQALHEKRSEESMSIEDATEIAGRHMPTYHVPSQVLGSRTIAKVLKNPNISTFSSYHYGVVKSLVNTIKDVNPKLLKTKEGRVQFKDGVDTMLAIAVANYALYPLADKLAEMIFGKGAEQRRAGPYHVIEGLTKAMEGEKDLTGLLWPVFSFNPMVSLFGQLVLNKKMFTGKEIYHPNDNLGENIQDAGTFILKQLPQGPGIVSSVSEEGGAASFAAKQLDIKAPTPKTQSIIERAKKRQEIARKSRETARKHGTYHP